MKIIHLSDLHVGKEDKGVIFQSIVNKINELTPASDYIIVITGDLIQSAIKDEKSNSIHLNEVITQITKLESSGFKVLVVPGNHDYGNAKKINSKLMTLFKTKLYGNANESFPRIYPTNDIVFIGLDSIEGEFDAKINSAEPEPEKVIILGTIGQIGKDQRDRLIGKLKDYESQKDIKFVVYLHNDPFTNRFAFYLKDRDELKTIFENKISLLLCGHTHENRTWDNWGFQTFNAGSSTNKKEYHDKIRCIDTSTVPFEVSFLTI